MSFAIARQPVFDKEGGVFGYEVYLRRLDNLDKYPEDIPYNKATFIIAELIAELGINRVSEGKRILVNVTLDSLLNKVLDLLPIDKVVFAIIPSQVDVGRTLMNSILKRIDDLREQGAMVAITEQLYSGKFVDLLHKAHIVEFTVISVDEGKASAVKRNNKKVLITRIETEEEKEKAFSLGDLFQGNLLGRPTVIKEFEIAPFLKSTLMRMIGALNTVQSIKDFAKIIASDVGMSAKLLRFVNSAYFSRRKEIKDIVQACSYLGMENLKKFTLLVATNDYVAVEDPYLWKRSLVRAILAEEIAKRRNPQIANEAYLAGLFSLIDKILGVDKIEFLKDVNVEQEIIDAYTGKNEELKAILEDAFALEEALEIGEPKLDEVVEEFSYKLRMGPGELKNLLFEAQTKAEEILKI